MAWVCTRLCKLQKGCTRLTDASDKVYQLLAHGRWFSPASSTTKTGRHDIAEILLKVALNTKNQSIQTHNEQSYIICTNTLNDLYDLLIFSPYTSITAGLTVIKLEYNFVLILQTFEYDLLYSYSKCLSMIYCTHTPNI